MLRVSVLGELTVEMDGRAVELPRAWRAHLVLAWLALHPGTHRRVVVAGTFWPDVVDDRARASLRNALWALRRVAGPGLLAASRERVGLDPAVHVDAAAFDQLGRAGRWEDAVALCRGELLAGVEDDWVAGPREAHQRRLSLALEALARQAETAVQLPRAIALSRRRAGLDALDEDAHAALIGRLAAAGDTAGALVCFERHRDALRRELGISPSPATQRLADTLRPQPRSTAPLPETDPAPSPPRRPPPGTVPSWAPGRRFPLPPRLRLPQAAPFVGRAGELAALRRAWGDACDGLGPLLVVVGGEAGIGKSRLARELTMRVRDGPAVVLQGTAQEDAIASLQPIVEAVGHLIRVAAPDALSRVLGARTGDLARLIPDLPAAPDGGSGDVGARRYRMVDAVAGLLAGVSAGAPVLVVVDDLHWADAATSSLLRHVLESRPGARVLVVATCREDAVPPGGHLAEALLRLDRAHLLRRVRLPGIDDAETASLARGLVGRELPPELLALVRQEAGGNPFFVQELLRHLGETGSTGLLALLRSEVPAAAREVIGHRLARLGGDCRRLLTIGAVVGREFDLEPLEQVSTLPAGSVVAALDEATAAGLLVELPGAAERFAFAHALVHRTLRERITRAHRRRLHARIADALQRSGRAELRDVAHHLCEAGPAGDIDAAVEVAERAADQALRNLAHAEAMELYIRAIALLPADDPRRRLLAVRRTLAFQALTHATLDAPRYSRTSSGVTSPTIS